MQIILKTLFNISVTRNITYENLRNFNESTNEIKNSTNIIIGEKKLKIFLSTNQKLVLFARKT